MKYPFYIIAILGLLIIGGCQESQEGQSAQTPITAENFKTIAGMQWILQQMTINGEAFELVGEKPFIQFNADENKVVGFASVNRFFGSVKIDEKGRFEWPGPFGSTRMAGPPQQMKQENTFLKALPQTEWLSKTGSNLYAVSDDGQTTLVFYVLYTP
ncbi:MAG: META domain-containing protein [Planctomycetota bacterium]|jgi:heat shock protein HslJ